MSRKYTNKDGELIYLSQEHLDRAVQIYEELANLSPSKRVSWRRLTKMMNSEGYEGSESSEQYRQVIKIERKKQGVLPDVTTYAELLSDVQTDSVKQEIGEMYQAKREMQEQQLSLNRTKRDWSRELMIKQTIVDSFAQQGLSSRKLPKFKPLKQSAKEMVVSLNDIHYNYDVPMYYTPELAVEIVNDYADKVIAIAKKEGISKITVYNGGDSIEGRLRAQSIADGNGSIVDQMIAVTNDVLIPFTEKLSESFLVDVLMLVGNHERLTESYKDALENESVIPIAVAMMDLAFRKNERIKLIEPLTPYYHILTINGFNTFLCHGDRHKLRDPNVLYKLSINHDVLLDIVMGGHFHGHSITEVGENRYLVITGAIKGPDAFSDKINAKSGRSQVAIIFHKDEFEIRQIQINGHSSLN